MNFTEILQNLTKKPLADCTDQELYLALLELVRQKSADRVQSVTGRKLYYISAEFLIGKLLSNNLINLGLYEEAREALAAAGKNLSDIEVVEPEPSLGNGGLGRLAACFLDSLATLNLPGDGVGLRYHFGLFHQSFENDIQNEKPDPWLTAHSWAEKTDITYPVELAGKEYEPDIAEEDYQREGICYVLISTTGLRDADGNLTPFSDEEVQERTQMAKELSQKAKETGDLKSVAEEAGLRPIESSMGRSNEGDGQEPLMLDAARALAVGEVSDPIETEEGWFLVQHTSDYDESGTVYWKEYLTEQAQQSYAQEIYEQWRADAQIVQNEEIMDSVIVKDVLKELL